MSAGHFVLRLVLSNVLCVWCTSCGDFASGACGLEWRRQGESSLLQVKQVLSELGQEGSRQGRGLLSKDRRWKQKAAGSTSSRKSPRNKDRRQTRQGLHKRVSRTGAKVFLSEAGDDLHTHHARNRLAPRYYDSVWKPWQHISVAQTISYAQTNASREQHRSGHKDLSLVDSTVPSLDHGGAGPVAMVEVPISTPEPEEEWGEEVDEEQRRKYEELKKKYPHDKHFQDWIKHALACCHAEKHGISSEDAIEHADKMEWGPAPEDQPKIPSLVETEDGACVCQRDDLRFLASVYRAYNEHQEEIERQEETELLDDLLYDDEAAGDFPADAGASSASNSDAALAELDDVLQSQDEIAPVPEHDPFAHRRRYHGQHAKKFSWDDLAQDAHEWRKHMMACCHAVQNGTFNTTTYEQISGEKWNGTPPDAEGYGKGEPLPIVSFASGKTLLCSAYTCNQFLRAVNVAVSDFFYDNVMWLETGSERGPEEALGDLLNAMPQADPAPWEDDPSTGNVEVENATTTAGVDSTTALELSTTAMPTTSAGEVEVAAGNESTGDNETEDENETVVVANESSGDNETEEVNDTVVNETVINESAVVDGNESGANDTEVNDTGVNDTVVIIANESSDDNETEEVNETMAEGEANLTNTSVNDTEVDDNATDGNNTVEEAAVNASEGENITNDTEIAGNESSDVLDNATGENETNEEAENLTASSNSTPGDNETGDAQNASSDVSNATPGNDTSPPENNTQSAAPNTTAAPNATTAVPNTTTTAVTTTEVVVTTTAFTTSVATTEAALTTTAAATTLVTTAVLPTTTEVATTAIASTAATTAAGTTSAALPTDATKAVPTASPSKSTGDEASAGKTEEESTSGAGGISAK
mmetsp:Transcript_55466/g.102603  ORF Transcript_55466/g.102603 Transcript_55466/m.102603 type:complete len:876 (+) Transcript_55466:71-2698(+)